MLTEDPAKQNARLFSEDTCAFIIIWLSLGGGVHRFHKSSSRLQSGHSLSDRSMRCLSQTPTQQARACLDFSQAVKGNRNCKNSATFCARGYGTAQCSTVEERTGMTQTTPAASTILTQDLSALGERRNTSKLPTVSVGKKASPYFHFQTPSIAYWGPSDPRNHTNFITFFRVKVIGALTVALYVCSEARMSCTTGCSIREENSTGSPLSLPSSWNTAASRS